MTYRELKLYADKLATALAELGVKKGDKAALILPNCPQYIISDFAILKAGAAVVPCSILHKAPDLEWQIGESGAETVICQDESLGLVNSVKPKTKLKNIIITSTKDYSPEESKNPERIAGTYHFRDLIAEHEPRPPEVEIDPMEDLAYVIFTGGATGLPKGVMLTHYNRLTNIQQGLPWLYAPLSAGIKGRASLLIPIPLFHVYGHWAMQSAIYWGLRILLVANPRDTDTIVRLMHEHRPLLVFTVPTQLMRMVEKKIGRMPVLVMSAAAPLPKEIADAISGELMMPVSEGYGLTETSPITHMNLTAFSKITGFAPSVKLSIGLPVPDTEVKLVSLDTGKECGPGEEGEIYIKGPQVMKGYWPTPGKGLVDGWLPTGDIARMDEDGYFYIVDRKKDMANISGYKVYTTVIDDILFQHPAVSMAAAIGIPDPERPGSERLKAFVKLKDEYKGKVSAEDIIEHCRAKCPPYAVPKFVEFREDLYFMVTEKLFKKALRDEEIEKMKAAGLLK
jgi:long-chain acyl-CoA synthetase